MRTRGGIGGLDRWTTATSCYWILVGSLPLRYISQMQRDIDRILISQEKIAERVKELAQQIVIDHTPPRMAGEAEITIVPILTGAMIFCCDLIRQIPIAMKIGLMTVSSYPGSSIRTQG